MNFYIVIKVPLYLRPNFAFYSIETFINRRYIEKWNLTVFSEIKLNLRKFKKRIWTWILTSLPRHLVNHVHGDSRFHTNNTVKGIKALEHRRIWQEESGLSFFCEMIATGQRSSSHGNKSQHHYGDFTGKGYYPIRALMLSRRDFWWNHQGMILTLWKIQKKTWGNAFVNFVRRSRITSWQTMLPMHYSVHGEG